MKKLVITAVILPVILFTGSVVFVLAKGALFPKPTPESRLLPTVQNQLEVREVSSKAIVDEATYDFGVMDPLTIGTHAFVIRNAGCAPLEIELGSTTCKCTFGKLKDSSILPGQTGEVTLSWNVGRKHPFYSHGATIHTNDPRDSTIDLRVQGWVRVQLGFDPPELLLPRIEPDTTPTAETILFTQDWDRFAVADVTSSLEGIEWTTEAVTDEAWLKENKANDARRLSVTVPPGLASGHFQHEVTVHVKKNGEGDLETFNMSLAGKVLKRLSAYGPKVTNEGVLELGTMDVGTPTQAKVLLKIRDELRELKIKELTVEPDFVVVDVKPTPGLEGKGLYIMTVDVPQDAPIGSHTGVNRGKIRMKIDHPRISDSELKLDFIVSPR